MSLGPLLGKAIVLLGAPASGKGTQGRLLSDAAGLSYLSTGRQLRKEVADKTHLGRLAEPYLAVSQFVPDQLVLDLVSEWINRVNGGWVLDGFPRTLAQAEELDRILAGDQARLRAALFEVKSDELERRVLGRRECQECSWTGNVSAGNPSVSLCPSCGGALHRRLDDNPENFRKRLDEFQKLTLPLVSFYEESGRLLKVCGGGTPEQVFASLQSELK